MAGRPRGPVAALFVAAALVGSIALIRARCTPASVACGGAFTRADTVESCGACGVRCAAVHGAAACVGGRCVLTCQEGFADCDGHPGNGCEVDLATDRAHCGACIKTCEGSRCAAGRCAARLLGTYTAITEITADDGAVYAIGKGVMKYPLDGSDPTPILRGELPHAAEASDDKHAPRRGRPEVSDGEWVFWAEPGAEGSVVRRIPKRGGEPAEVTSHPVRIASLAANRTHLFWADERHRIFAAPRLP